MKERRRFPRIAVNLNVALLDGQALPRGCRVRDVSAGGMLLQYGQPGGACEPGQSVKIRASLRDGDERRVLVLPARVVRNEEKGVGVAFERPQAELMQLLEPYRLDRDEAAAAPLDEEQEQPAEMAVDAGGRPLSAVRPRHRYRTPDGGARLAERIAAAREALASPGHRETGSGQSPAAAGATRSDRRVLQLGLASLAIAVAIVVFDLAAGSSTRQRLEALEAAAHRQAEALADVQIRLTAERDRERLVLLDNRVSELASSVATLETGHFTPADSESPAPTNTESPATATPSPASAAAGKAESDTGAAAAAPAATAEGPWVINLVSLFDEAAAQRFSRQARELGIAVSQNRAEVRGRPVWRVQVAGFPTRAEAVAYSDSHKDSLGLEKVWIFKR